VVLASCGIFRDLVADLQNAAHSPLAPDFRAVIALANLGTGQLPDSAWVKRRLVHRYLRRVELAGQQLEHTLTAAVVVPGQHLAPRTPQVTTVAAVAENAGRESTLPQPAINRRRQFHCGPLFGIG